MWAKAGSPPCTCQTLTDPGDYVVFDLGPESILLTCNGAGTVQAFYNLCQHRGVRLVDDHAGNTENFAAPITAGATVPMAT